MSTGEYSHRPSRARDAAGDDDGAAPAFPHLEYGDETPVERSAEAAPPKEAGDGVQWNEGRAFVEELVHSLGLHDAIEYENWPSPIAKLYRMYKSARRTFLKGLYGAAHDLFPRDVLDNMARPVRERDANGDRQWTDVEVRNSEVLSVLAKEVAKHSSAERVHTEMMLALAAEWVGRWYVDEWCRVDRQQRSAGAEEERIGRKHAAHKDKLKEVYEILKPGYLRWNAGGEASLLGVKEAMDGIYYEQQQ